MFLSARTIVASSTPSSLGVNMLAVSSQRTQKESERLALQCGILLCYLDHVDCRCADLVGASGQVNKGLQSGTRYYRMYP